MNFYKSKYFDFEYQIKNFYRHLSKDGVDGVLEENDLETYNIL